MFIVVEGTDGSGKSSLIAEIEHQLKDLFPRQSISVFHKGRPEEESRRWALHEYAVNISLQPSNKTVSLADRWHWGEVTYAPLKRPHTCTDAYGLLGTSGWRWVELFLLSRGVAQFWLHQPLDVIVSRVASRGDEFIKTDELKAVLERYEFCAKTAVANLAGELTPRPNSKELIPALAQHVIEVASARALEAAPLADFPEYIGPPNPSMLLVGDNRNDKTVTILPFMPVNHNSGDYLMSALPEDLWRTVGIINGDDINGARLRRLITVLGDPNIVALGRMAERHIVNSDISRSEYGVVPHPQYVRRFHHHDKVAYGEAIKRHGQYRKRIEDPWTLR